MLQPSIAAVAMMVTGVISTTIPASAAENFYSSHDYRHRQSQVSFSTDGLPSTLPGGTYVGAVAALRVRGNGNYFAVGGDLSGGCATVTEAPQHAPKAKIFTVRAETAGNACAYENGVCIIRP